MNLGVEEILLLGVLFLLLLGVEGVPEIARRWGGFQRRLREAQREIEREILEEEGPPATLLAFEAERERKAKESLRPERVRLERAALQLGIDPEGLSDEELSRRIVEFVQEGDTRGSSPGGKSNPPP